VSHPIVRVPLRRLALLLFILSTLPAAAQSNRVFVSARTGSDANACNSVTTPCLTFQGAVDQVAPSGSVIVLDTGGYGSVTIGKALTIEAPTGIVAFIHPPSGHAITVSAGPSDVVILRGLSLSVGTGSGIEFLSGGVLKVENCVLNKFDTGIRVLAPGLVLVSDTTIRASSVGVIVGSGLAGPAKVSLERCRLKGNGYGMISGGDSSVSVRASNISGNLQGGLILDSHLGGGISGDLNVEDCLLAHNGTAIMSLAFGGGLGLVRVSNSTIAYNATGLFANGGALLSRVNNTVEGNTTNTTGTITPFSSK
jgi:Right handed beta helix region